MHRRVEMGLMRAADAPCRSHAARSRLWALAQSLLVFLVPSFAWPLIRGGGGIGLGAAKKRMRNATAYLDGLRGVAALIVFAFHLSYAWFPALKNGYGVTPRDHFFLQWPLVRAVVSGRGGVVVFFVISGYVLSVKTVTLASRGQHGEALEALAQSAFRRAFRLYVPIVASTFLTALAVRLDIFLVHPLNTNLPPRLGTLPGQLSDWALATTVLMNPFRPIPGRNNLYSPPYNGHLWTIPMEMKGSLMVFGFLLALARTRRWVRTAVTAVLAYSQSRQGDLDMMLFLSGMLLAELSITLSECDDGKRLRSRAGYAAHIGRSLACVLVFLAGLHMLGYPEENDGYSRGYAWMSAHVPAPYSADVYTRQFFWHAVGGVAFVGSLVWAPRPTAFSFYLFRSWQRPGQMAGDDVDIEAMCRPLVEKEADAEDAEPYLQRPFTTHFAQYLGRASYPLYLIHGPVIQSVAIRWLIPAVESYNRDATESRAAWDAGRPDAADASMALATSEYLGHFVLSATVSTAVVFYLSDLFMRAVDMHASRIGRRAMKLCWARAPETSLNCGPGLERNDRQSAP